MPMSPRRSPWAAAARRATASRPAVRSAATAGGNAVHRAWLASIDANADKAAMAAGFRDLDSMLQATRALPAHEVARLLNLTTKQVWALRRRHGHPSTGGGRPPGLGADDERQCLQCGRWYRGLGQHIVMAHRISLQDYRNQHPIDPAALENPPAPPAPPRARRAALTPHELARIPRGEQPDDGTGRLLCLTCGHWYRGLGQHIAAAHRMPVTDYRRHHGLQASQRRSR